MGATNEGDGIVDILRRVRPLLPRRQKAQYLSLFLLMVAGAVADVVSLGAVVPFIAVMTTPDRVLDFPIVSEIAGWIDLTDPDDLLLPVAVAFSVAAVVSGGMRILVVWATVRVSVATDCAMSREAYRRTLYQPYARHLHQNSSDLLATITAKTSSIGNEILRPLVLFAGSVVIIGAVGGTLIAIDAQIAAVTGMCIGGAYLLTAGVSRRRLSRNGSIIAKSRPRSLKRIQEGLGGIRDVILDGTQEVHVGQFDRDFRDMRLARARNTFINSTPRLILETFGVVVLAGIVYGFSSRRGGVEMMLPVIGAVVFAAQRLIPTAHQLFASWAAITGGRAEILDALELLEQPTPAWADEPPPVPMPFGDAFVFDAVCFSYVDCGPRVLDGFDLEVRKGWTIGLVGTTGSGKSTTLDLLMGLLEPSEGRILVDGVEVDRRNRRSWQRNVAHVPQAIFLADASIAENIALGVPKALVDDQVVRDAARQARILDFVESLEEGFDTVIGERGVRLSGGQRQRLGLARAFYRRSRLLVLDEATSALDNETEREVVDSLDELEDLTVVMVAHRLSTVRGCDRIYLLEGGRITAFGTYDELLATCPTFRQMAQAPDEPGGSP